MASARRARQLHPKGRPIPLPRDVHGSLVRLDDFRNDVQAETQALVASRLALPASKRIEQMGQYLRRNAAAVAHHQDDLVLRPPQTHLDRSVAAAMLDGVSDQVGCDLRDAIGIPHTGAIALATRLDGTLRHRRSIFENDVLDQRLEVGGLRLDGYA